MKSIKNFARKFRNRLVKLKIRVKRYLRLSKVYLLEEDEIKSFAVREAELDVVIFSKDRPLQLLSLLESMDSFTKPKIQPHIIYNAKNNDYEQAYQELFTRYSNLFAKFYNDQEKGFKQTLIDLLDSLEGKKVVFFVDDIIFINSLEWKTLLRFDSQKTVPSLRLGLHLSRCYTTNDRQELPPMTKLMGLCWWKWSEGDYDWAYPLSVDGHIFSKKEFLDMVQQIDFKAPNTLELGLQKFRPYFESRLGTCFEHSVIVNNPVNRVQDEIQNLHGSVHQDELLAKWREGERLDFLRYKNFIPQSAHQELELTFIPQKNKLSK